MTNYTNSWFAGMRSNFMTQTSRFCYRPVRGLEIGSFEGQSSNWLVENWCMHPDSRLTCIDPFTGSVENTTQEKNGLFERFNDNTQHNQHKMRVLREESVFALSELLRGGEKFDFAYIDGDHHSFSTALDAIMVDKLLDVGGLIAFDDYLWCPEKHTEERPRDAIDYFLKTASRRYKVDFSNYQVFVTKTA